VSALKTGAGHGESGCLGVCVGGSLLHGWDVFVMAGSGVWSNSAVLDRLVGTGWREWLG
jgi:hypothetical protein